MKLSSAACAAALLIASNGCGKPVLRVADASLGDYSTEKEFKKLSQEQREEYCNELAEQRETYQGQIADAEEALAAIRLRARSSGADAESLHGVAARLEERLASERARVGTAQPREKKDAPPTPAAQTYVVKPGDSLWRISGQAGILGRSAEWKRLYEANRDRIQNPDRIYPGQEIQIPQ